MNVNRNINYMLREGFKGRQLLYLENRKVCSYRMFDEYYMISLDSLNTN